MPFDKNMNNFIYEIHKSIWHKNYTRAIKEVMKRNYFFKGITNYIKKYVIIALFVV